MIQKSGPFGETENTITLNGMTFKKVQPKDVIKGGNLFLESTKGIVSITCENLYCSEDLTVFDLAVEKDCYIEGVLDTMNSPKIGQLYAKGVKGRKIEFIEI